MRKASRFTMIELLITASHIRKGNRAEAQLADGTLKVSTAWDNTAR